MNESTLPIGDHSKHEPIDLKSLRRIFNVPGDNPDKDNMIPYAEAAEAIKSALNSENPENALAYINRWEAPSIINSTEGIELLTRAGFNEDQIASLMKVLDQNSI